ncbi:MAG: polysaccharide deacetylase family protein [Chromatiaceae bacterium]|nr:polysaccharide deacetylase family protein [Gammaproteobacteria bacterium]MCP5445742.1 polysaccharide deacetylase family protein [Chromatiaceae bacterium]
MLDPITRLLTLQSMSGGVSAYAKPIVLMYHGTTFGKPSCKYSISAEMFNEHLKFLKTNGWNTILFRDLLKGFPFSPKTIVLTFDDGYANNYIGAFKPILKYRMKATWFITTDCVGREAHWQEQNQGENSLLDHSQLKKMAENGMEIASHTCSHPDLTSLSYEKQTEEMRASKHYLEMLIRDEVVSFAYPFGKFDEKSIEAVRNSGYKIACTTNSGSLSPETDSMLVPRITIFRNDSVSDLARKLIFSDNEVPLRKISAYYMNRIRQRLHFGS